jgi:hypothetical protein
MSSNIFITNREYQESIEKKIQSISPSEREDMQKILQKIVETSIQNREFRGEKTISLYAR